MRVYTSKGFIVSDYKIILAELKAPSHGKVSPSSSYTFTADINSATIFESYDYYGLLKILGI